MNSVNKFDVIEYHEDDKYICVMVPKEYFQNIKKSIPKMLNNSKLAFINSAAKLVYYQK